MPAVVRVHERDVFSHGLDRRPGHEDAHIQVKADRHSPRIITSSTKCAERTRLRSSFGIGSPSTATFTPSGFAIAASAFDAPARRVPAVSPGVCCARGTPAWTTSARNGIRRPSCRARVGFLERPLAFRRVRAGQVQQHPIPAKLSATGASTEHQLHRICQPTLQVGNGDVAVVVEVSARGERLDGVEAR